MQREEESEMTDKQANAGASEPDWQALLRVAGELQRWVDAFPIWSESSGEAWLAFLRRHGTGEKTLEERLRRMPGCTIARSPNGSTTTLSLARVEARSPGGLAAACRSWIDKVQRTALGVLHPPT